MKATLTVEMDSRVDNIGRVLRQFIGDAPITKVVVAEPATAEQLAELAETDPVEFVARIEPASEPVAGEVAAPPEAPKTRKPRADAGKTRGPQQKTTEPAAPATPKQNTEGSDKSATPAPAAAVGAPVAAVPGKELTLDDAREALGRLNKTPNLGMPACMQHLQEFGTNRISAVKKEDYALFIQQADAKVAEALAAAAK